MEKIEFSGVITAVEMGLWTIGNFQVQVTADTEVKGDPVLGETVEVEAFVHDNGTLVAHEIEIERVTVPVDDTHVDDDKDDADDDESDDHSNSGDDDADHDDSETTTITTMVMTARTKKRKRKSAPKKVAVNTEANPNL